MSNPTHSDTTINYNIYGKGETTLLFVHGSYIDQTWWDEQVKFFEKDHRVVTLDLAGHGKSGRGREHWSIEGMADDVVSLIRQLELKNIIIIGHSLGGDISLMAAVKYPDPIIGFIAVDNFKNAGTPLAKEHQDQVAGILDNLKKDFAGTNEQYARMVLLTKDTPKPLTDKVVQAYRTAYEPMGQATMPEVFELDKPEKELLPKLKHKLYLINVNYIPTNTDALKKNAGNGFELIEIAGTSHFPMIESPAVLNEALKKVINEIEEGR